MPLAEILIAVTAELTTVGVTTATGGEHLAAHAVPPRIVWVPTSGRFGPPEGPGQNPRPLRTRILTVQAHVWGASMAAAELLLHDLVRAIHLVAHGSYEVISEEWPPLDAELLRLGSVVVLTLLFKIPVTDAALATAIVTDAEADVAFDPSPTP